MKLKDEIYDKGIVKKPWGFEYVLLRDQNSVSVTFLNINYKKQTSLHCHPKKKTGFIILKGNAQVQFGIYKENNKKYNPLSRLVMRPGLFHSLKSTSKNGLVALELESPVDKNDLIRFKDNYGRESKSYEGKDYIKNNFEKKFVINLKSYKEQKFKIDNVLVKLEKQINFNNIKKNDKSTSAIIKGSIKDKKGKVVIDRGEIVKTKTLKILSKAFNNKNSLTILRVSRVK
jgi:mannose-6-phosphate isomerase-like protein (cupin superfamily)